MKKYVSAVLIVFSAAIIFAAKPRVPDWLSVPSSVYPMETYFNGVGSGETREVAELDAVRNLSAIFGQTVKSKTTASKKMEQAISQGKVVVSSNGNLQQNITSQVDVENIIGVDIAEYFYNKSEKKWYAIAVLHKEKAAEIYKSLIKKNDESVRLAQIEAQKDLKSFYGYSEVNFALEIAKENDRLLKNLSVINFDMAEALNKEIVSSQNLQILQKRIADNITIYLNISGDKNNKTKSAFQNIFSKYGFKTTQDKNVRYSMSGKYSSEINKKGNVFYCIYTLDLDFIDSADSKSLFAINLKGREGSTSEQDAINRTYRVLENNIATEFSKNFDSYINNLSFKSE